MFHFRIDKFDNFEMAEDGTISLKFLNMPLIKGQYYVDVSIEYSEGFPEDYIKHAAKFEVVSNLEDMGIAGILDNKFQRTGNPVENAVNSLFNPELIKPMTKDMASKEELHEHELADIFKLALKISDVKSEIANRSDVIGNKEQLGYLNELINEKIVNLEPNEKFEVENKIEALQSIESQISLSDLMDMHVFCSEKEPNVKHSVTLTSLKDIDGYGYSFFEEAEKIMLGAKVKALDERHFALSRVKGV